MIPSGGIDLFEMRRIPEVSVFQSVRVSEYTETSAMPGEFNSGGFSIKKDGGECDGREMCMAAL